MTAWLFSLFLRCESNEDYVGLNSDEWFSIISHGQAGVSDVSRSSRQLAHLWRLTRIYRVTATKVARLGVQRDWSSPQSEFPLRSQYSSDWQSV
jgi:hypothetical protein